MRKVLLLDSNSPLVRDNGRTACVFCLFQLENVSVYLTVRNPRQNQFASSIDAHR